MRYTYKHKITYNKYILFGWIVKDSPNVIEIYDSLIVVLMLKQSNVYLVINAYISPHVYVYEIFNLNAKE